MSSPIQLGQVDIVYIHTLGQKCIPTMAAIFILFQPCQL